MKPPAQLKTLILSLSLLASLPLAAATTAIPLPSGHEAIAEWGGTREFWSNPGPGGAAIAGVRNARSETPSATAGTFLLSSNVNANASYIPEFLKPGRNTTFTIAASGITAPVPDLLTFQMVAIAPPTTLNLTIGSTTYSIAQAVLSTDTSIATTGDNIARYEGLYTSGLAPVLYTYTWDLNALEFAGQIISDFTLTFLRSGTNWDTYDMQVSFGSAVPEPSLSLLAMLGLSALLLRRRRKPHSPSQP